MAAADDRLDWSTTRAIASSVRSWSTTPPRRFRRVDPSLAPPDELLIKREERAELDRAHARDPRAPGRARAQVAVLHCHGLARNDIARQLGVTAADRQARGRGNPGHRPRAADQGGRHRLPGRARARVALRVRARGRRARRGARSFIWPRARAAARCTSAWICGASASPRCAGAARGSGAARTSPSASCTPEPTSRSRPRRPARRTAPARRRSGGASARAGGRGVLPQRRPDAAGRRAARRGRGGGGRLSCRRRRGDVLRAAEHRPGHRFAGLAGTVHHEHKPKPQSQARACRPGAADAGRDADRHRRTPDTRRRRRHRRRRPRRRRLPTATTSAPPPAPEDQFEPTSAGHDQPAARADEHVEAQAAGPGACRWPGGVRRTMTRDLERRRTCIGPLPSVSSPPRGRSACSSPRSPRARPRAGQFTVASCQADRLNFSTTAFTDFATRGMKIRRACNPEGPGCAA